MTGNNINHCNDFSARIYRDTILAWDLLNEWAALAEAEPDEIEELDMEF